MELLRNKESIFFLFFFFSLPLGRGFYMVYHVNSSCSEIVFELSTVC